MISFEPRLVKVMDWSDGPVSVMLGDVRERLADLPEASVQCVVTSPPYWGLRDYKVDGQLGLEATPELYVEQIAEVFADVARVLRKDGTLWLNLGDSYGSGTAKGRLPTQTGKHGYWQNPAISLRNGGPAKQLLGIPWRVAFALQGAGWYLRSDIIWSKPNPMPESVQDRPTKAHEYLFLLTRTERYYYDAEAIREASVSPEQEAHNQRYAKPYAAFDDRARETGQPGNENNRGIHSRPGRGGRNKRSVWEIATQPYLEAHFATFPEALVEPCVLAGSRQGDLVLDPFAGSGTTLAVARRLGRRAIGIEFQPDYLPLIQRRVREAALPLVEVMDGLPEQSFSTLNEV